MNAKHNFIWVFFYLAVFLAACLFVLPSFMDACAGIWQTSAIGRAVSREEDLSDEEKKTAMERALAYNEELALLQDREPFVYRGLTGEGTEYDTLLSSGEDDTMAYLEIPAIDLYLPVCHGTGSEKLQYEAGHMYGTSLPIGGESSHAVLAAHTGLPAAELFTDLIRVEEGDVFFIHVLNEVHRYTVDRILTVPQGTESPYLGVENGKDYVTLYTCTPYGVNDHRLLVRGVRTYPDPADEGSGEGLVLRQRNMKETGRAALLGAVPALVLAAGCADLNKRTGRRRKHIPDGKAEK